MQKITDFNVSTNCGIYCIYNTVNHKRYIGSAINLHERLTQHYSELSKNIHFNLHLQRSFQKYGSSAFEIDVIKEFEAIEYNDLLKLEDFYILKYNTIDSQFGYNKRTNTTFPILLKESIAKRKVKHDKHKIKVKAFVRETGEFYKEFDSITDCANDLHDQTTNICFALNNVSRSVKGYVIIKSSDYDPNLSYKYIPFKRELESKETIRLKQINNPKNKKVYVWTKDGVVEYFSISEATRQLGLKKDSLSHVLKRYKSGIRYDKYYITFDENEDYSYYNSAKKYEPGVIKNQFSK